MIFPPKEGGARFFKCDFQVHTLRDANWSGPFNALTQRKEFAEALIADCRRNGVSAVGITDHHDLCMWKHVAQAALNEADLSGKPLSPQERVVVFPGVELTLSNPPCQAIVLFDPDLNTQILEPIWGALGLVPNEDSEAKTTNTLPLDLNLDLKAITDRLEKIRINPNEQNPNKHAFLKGKFIILPNLKAHGHKTIVRKGFNNHFATMPCVGGYIEGCNYTDLDEVNRAKIEGKDRAWGSKNLGVFQTSDCREAKKVEAEYHFSDLGRWPTWVKWGQPSAEAIRQACLAKRSRISHIEPVYPLYQITGIEVTNSQFLGPVRLGLNQQFNAFIGGRGTGKSSLLEYIRWALCDDISMSSDSSELPDFQKRRRNLIENTLKPLSAGVKIYYKKNEVTYIIERSTSQKSDSILVSDPSGSSQVYTSEQIRKEFPIVSYGQKQLSCVGTLPEEINRLITDPIKIALATIRNRIENEILLEQKQLRTRALRLEVLNIQIFEQEASIKSKKDQILALQAQLQALTPEQQKIVDVHELLNQQENTYSLALDLPINAIDALEQCKRQLLALGVISAPKEAPNIEALTKICAEANAYIQKVIANIGSLIINAKDDSWLSLEGKAHLDTLKSISTAHVTAYNDCLQANAKNDKQLSEIRNLNAEVAVLENNQAHLLIEKSNLSSLINEMGTKIWDSFLNLINERHLLLKEQCDRIARQAQNEFRPEIKFCGDSSKVRESISKVITGRNIKDSEEKIRSLSEAIIETANPILTWGVVMAEFDKLHAERGKDFLPETPFLRMASFTDANLESIRKGVKSETLEQIRYLNIEDNITFSFRLGKQVHNNENYIPFNSASPGQQATCLLRTLLAQEGAPLLIDQPEEDLDNEQIHILSERISDTKHNRQLIFVSHNANIVVNGDAELVVCFSYAEHDDNAHGTINQAGSIDCGPVRDAITRVMEGGRQAFALRQQKYGF